jgi:ankyrin repeat protein
MSKDLSLEFMILAVAINQVDITEIQSLISNGCPVNGQLADFDGQTPLMIARSNLDIVEILLNAGADVNATDNDGDTACHRAALMEDVDLVSLLIARGANLALKGWNARTPLDVMFGRGIVTPARRRVVLALVNGGAPLDNATTCCRVAAMSTECIQALVNRGVAVGSLRDTGLQTPLHFANATTIDGAAAIRMLINECGVDVDAKDRSNDTACHRACAAGVLTPGDQTLRCLIAEGANIELTSGAGVSPLYVACMSPSGFECVVVLLAAGADVHSRSMGGRTPCHLIINPMSKHFLPALLAAGADLDIADDRGTTARQLLKGAIVDEEQIDAARRRIAKERLNFVRYRALQICIGLQSRGLDALSICEILQRACGPVGPLISFHHWWAIATTVKHFSH